EDAADCSRTIEHRHRTRDPEAAGRVERVRLRPHELALRGGEPEVRTLRRAIAVVVRASRGRARAVGGDAFFLEPDTSARGKTPVDEDVAGRIPPRSHEAVAGARVAHPRDAGERAQRGEGEALELPLVVGIELAGCDELRT